MKKLTLILVAIATFALSAATLKAQTIQDFHGNWKGLSQSGDSIEITLNPNWSCVFKINNVQVFANNAIVVYRLPGYHSSLAASFVDGDPQLIRFYTQNAMQGILAPGTQVQSNQEANGVPQTYTGRSKIYTDNNGATVMDLFIEVQTFSSNPPYIYLGSSDDANEIEPTLPWCQLVKL